MVLDVGNQWRGVSGVPGLGVSIPRLRSAVVSNHPPGEFEASQRQQLDQWDKHVKKQSKLTTNRKKNKLSSTKSGPLDLSVVKVELPRVLLPHSTSCCGTNGGRSVGSRGSSHNWQSVVGSHKGSVHNQPTAGSPRSSALSPDQTRKHHSYNNKSDELFTVAASLPHVPSPARISHERNDGQRRVVSHHLSFRPVPPHLGHPIIPLHQQGHLYHRPPPHKLTLPSHRQSNGHRSLTKSLSLHKPVVHKPSFTNRFVGSEKHQRSSYPQQDRSSTSLPIPTSSNNCGAQCGIGYRARCSCSLKPPCELCCQAQYIHQNRRVVFNNESPIDSLPDCSPLLGGDCSPLAGNSPPCPGNEPVLGCDNCHCHLLHPHSRYSAQGSHKDYHHQQLLEDDDQYKLVREAEGDYSYAYSDSVSPAFLIRVGDLGGGNYPAKKEGNYTENIYEEIKVGSKAHDNKESVTISEDSSCSKTKLRRAMEKVARSSIRSMRRYSGKDKEEESENKEFHLSISKGRKKQLLDRAKMSGSGWDCADPNDEDVFTPSDDIQEDSGFHSGGMVSLTSCSNSAVSKASNKSSITGDEIPLGQLKKCESMDLKEQILDPKTPSEIQWTRSKLIRSDNNWEDDDKDNKTNDKNKVNSVSSKCLKKLSSLPMLGLNRRNSSINNKGNINQIYNGSKTYCNSNNSNSESNRSFTTSYRSEKDKAKALYL